MPTFEDMHQGNSLTEWYLEADTEVAFDQIRWIVKEYQQKVHGDRVAELTTHVVRDREYKLFVEGREFVDVDDDGFPHFFPVTQEKNVSFPDAIFYIFKIGEDSCTILLAVRPGEEVLPDYWNGFAESLDARLRRVGIRFHGGSKDSKRNWRSTVEGIVGRIPSGVLILEKVIGLKDTLPG